MQSVVFQKDVEDDFVETRVAEFVFLLFVGLQGQLLDELFFFRVADGRIDAQNIGIEANKAFQCA